MGVCMCGFCNVLVCVCDSIVIRPLISNSIYYPFTDEAQTALFKDPVRTAL